MCMHYMHTMCVCGKDTTLLLPLFFPYRDPEKSAKRHLPLPFLCTACGACLPLVLSQGMRPEICQQVSVFAFSLDQSSLQERQAPAMEHNTTQDVCLVLVYLCLCNEVEKNLFKGRGTLRNLRRGES